MTIIGMQYPDNANISCNGSYLSVSWRDGGAGCPICGDYHKREQLLHKQRESGLLPLHCENSYSDFFQQENSYEGAREKVLIKKIKYIHDSISHNDGERFFQEMISVGDKHHQLWVADKWIKKLIPPNELPAEAFEEDRIKDLKIRNKALNSRWHAWQEYCNNQWEATRLTSKMEDAAYKQASKIVKEQECNSSDGQRV